MKLKNFIILLLFGVFAVAQSFAATGKAGNNIKWELDNSGVLTFSGSGEMKDFGEIPYNPQFVKTVIINDGITSIGANAFKNCVNLTDVTMPASITQIGNKAFFGCKKLPSVNIPYGVTEIGNEAFAGCIALSEINLPGSVTMVGAKAFKGCKGLVKIRIPESVSSIGTETFKDCPLITKIIELPDFVTATVAKNYSLNPSTVEKYWKAQHTEVAPPSTVVAQGDYIAQSEPKKAAAVPASDVDVAIPHIGQQNAKTFALIISNENYSNMEDVPFALNDGSSFRNYCEHTLGIPANNIIHYSDASSGTMREALSELKMANRIVGSDMKVIFYYSGHGAPDPATKEGYLIPVDARRVNPEVCLPLTKLYETLGDMDVAMTTVFLDACFSGGERNGGTLLADNGERAVKIKQKASAPKGRMVVFSATDGDETALPYKGKGHGIFTYFLLKKLKDSAGNTSLAELADYLKSNVTSTAFSEGRKIQTPTVATSSQVQDSWRTRRLND